MRRIEFFARNGMHTVLVRHGTASIHSKLDTGSPISVMDLNAVERFTGGDADIFLKEVEKHSISPIPFWGYGRQKTKCYLCSITSFWVGNYFFPKYFTAVSCFRNTNMEGIFQPKILLGEDLLSCCRGTIEYNGNILLDMVNEGLQKQMMLKIFSENFLR